MFQNSNYTCSVWLRGKGKDTSPLTFISSIPLMSTSPRYSPGSADSPPKSSSGKRRRARPSGPKNPASSPMTPPAKRDPRAPADISVLVSRVDLYDSEVANSQTKQRQQHTPEHGRLLQPIPTIAPFRYQPPSTTTSSAATPAAAAAATTTSTLPYDDDDGTIAVVHVPPENTVPPAHNPLWMQLSVVDRVTTCPYTNESINKYWKQRRRLFSRFDQGVQLDQEGWFSVTPEQIADHVSHTLRNYLFPPNQPLVVLDAFAGCGGNAISFSKQPNVTVVGVDVDRSKLRRAAHNASIYGIPPERLLLIECDALFILEFCFKDGQFVLDQPLDTPEAATALMNAMPPPVATEVTPDGYQIGGIDLLPRTIDAIFMDPPWGGVDYEVFGKHGYDLARNMKIERSFSKNNTHAVGNDFFDTFSSSSGPRNRQERKAQFNCVVDDTNCVNGAELVKLAARATRGCVLYDVPRNTSRQSLGQAALAAGYRGNCRLDEHYLNGRLKTVTAYFGRDWSDLLAAKATTSTLVNHHPGLMSPAPGADGESPHEAPQEQS